MRVMNISGRMLLPETVKYGYSPEELFKKLLKNSRENTLEEVLFSGESLDVRPETLIKTQSYRE